jgi:hypothetical protein
MSTRAKSKPTKGIDSFFGKKAELITHDESVEETSVSSGSGKDEKDKKVNPLEEEFNKSLSPNEKIAHELAKSMLGTSYDVMRTHGFISWLKSKKE